MTAEIPQPEKEEEAVDDNARKFEVGPIDTQFLEENKAKSFELTVDWLETDKDSETKLAYKDRGNGDVKILLITKITDEATGKRKTVREEITEENYRELLHSSELRLKKKRYEFTYTQNSTPFSINYDEYADSKLRILEVDAPKVDDSTEEDRKPFDREDFPIELAEEVSGNRRYDGYRIADLVRAAQ
jgi:hypothetical protein